MTKARSSIVKDGVEGIYHCISQCVRRAFLCGRDTHTDRNYEYRKQWLRHRLIDLTDILLIDVCSYAFMGNHLHVILRNRPDLATTCSGQDIARRWLCLFPKRRNAINQPEQQSAEELASILVENGRVTTRKSEVMMQVTWSDLYKQIDTVIPSFSKKAENSFFFTPDRLDEILKSENFTCSPLIPTSINNDTDNQLFRKHFSKIFPSGLIYLVNDSCFSSGGSPYATDANQIGTFFEYYLSKRKRCFFDGGDVIILNFDTLRVGIYHHSEYTYHYSVSPS
ncbi:hypothetical protein SCOR_27230 [Sulfidibacter corallicola]|uniref:Transposase IS200-like domain-containing protein n=1 Tax=Sulfidibacter corallicola TaxID=2818388 RepID=A0A8A4TMH8_SULCO|nr:hypothetical protein [Sulfidibacter corallicola]QTD50753.1 hypothetical protein J3U87_34645 [Sulfidibacter corallicola]